jgi:hypothetical protein
VGDLPADAFEAPMPAGPRRPELIWQSRLRKPPLSRRTFPASVKVASVPDRPRRSWRRQAWNTLWLFPITIGAVAARKFVDQYPSG